MSEAPSKPSSALSRGRRSLGTVKKARAKDSLFRKWLKRIVFFGILATIVSAAGAAFVFWYYGRNLPTVASLKAYRPPQVTRVVDRRGRTLAELFTERRTVVPMTRIPRHLVLCVLAAEDADFYRHEGLDYAGILRALMRDVMRGRASQGASTITQQIVKLTLLTPERSLPRKIRELILARRLEQEMTKDEILHLYLNHINFGHGRYGVQEAAQFYFGKNVEDLTLAESSLIAGVPQSPTRLSPRSHPEAARQRQLFVLGQLEAKRAEYWPDLTLEQITAARDAHVRIVAARPEADTAPEAVAIARRALREAVGDEAAARGGYTITTTIDLELQAAARQALRDGLEKLDQRQSVVGALRPPARNKMPRWSREQMARPLATGRTYDAIVTGTNDAAGTVTLSVEGKPGIAELDGLGRFNRDHLPPSRFAPNNAVVRVFVERLPEEGARPGTPARVRIELGAQGAVVAIDERTRDVLALVGGYDADGGFDRATQAVRQPGSTFKPIVYAFGIRSRRVTAASLLIDAPEVFDRWQPRNYETWSYRGAIRAREALAQSVNLVAVKMLQELGPDQVVPFAHSLGITTQLEPSLALALGASDVRPIELVNAYATFGAGGRFAPTRIVSKITAPDGHVIDFPVAAAVEAMTAPEAFVVTSMLTSVVQTGTGMAAQRVGRPVAGKTGTSNDARDAWFVGFSPDVACGVWVGFDDRRSLGRRESGGRTALPIWVEVMRAATRGRPSVDFPVPSGIVTTRIDPATGLLAWEGQPNALEEVFLQGTVPTETATPSNVVDSTSFLMEQIGEGAAGVAPTQVPPAAPSAP